MFYGLERLTAKERWQEHGYLFGSRYGTGLYQSTLRRHHETLISKAEVPRLTRHELRHTHTNLALLRDLDIKEVSRRLVDSTVGITLDVYQHLYPEQDKVAALSSDELLGGQQLPVVKTQAAETVSTPFQILLPSICRQRSKRRGTRAVKLTSLTRYLGRGGQI